MSIIVIDLNHVGGGKENGSSAGNARGPSRLRSTASLAITRGLLPVPEAHGPTAVLTRNGDVDRSRVRASARCSGLQDRCASNHPLQRLQRLQRPHAGCGDIRAYALGRRVGRANEPGATVRSRGNAAPGSRRQACRFAVLSPAQHQVTTAACLVDVSFMDVPQEDQRLALSTYQQGLAEGLAAAVDAYARQSLAVAFEVEPYEPPEEGREEFVR